MLKQFWLQIIAFFTPRSATHTSDVLRILQRRYAHRLWDSLKLGRPPTFIEFVRMQEYIRNKPDCTFADYMKINQSPKEKQNDQ